MSAIPLGRYLLQAPLDSGSSGEVWRAMARGGGSAVAIKVLKPSMATQPVLTLRLNCEIRAVACLDHPAIINVVDVGLVSPASAALSAGRLVADTPWFAMELASGGSLAPFRPLPDWASLRAMLVCVLDALAHAHACGLLHLDIKPGNLLLCDDNDARPGLKLTDWGLARALRSADPHRSRAGTRHFMAPEQLTGDWRAFGPWTDLYALGCTAWRLSVGRVPFTGLVDTRLRQAKLNGKLPNYRPKIRIPFGFRTWLGCLLARDPADRFPHAAAAFHALNELEDLGGEPFFPSTPVITLGP